MTQINTLKMLLLASEIRYLHNQDAELSEENAIKILLLADMILRIKEESDNGCTGMVESGEAEGSSKGEQKSAADY